MPDTPVIVDGNAQKFTIRLPKGEHTRAFGVDGTIELASTVSALRIVVTNSQGSTVLPLGTNWGIRIEEAP